ncbi:MAG: hypothetical protein FJX57_09035 [Alphaproteobacteria bacterium]|nr:hypothetical protein [Alphaproteobacteria bacterium]
MATSFDARLDILPPPQRRLWPELATLPAKFALYGGTGVALWLGHRVSVDFGFMTWDAFDPHALAAALPFLANATILQSAANTLTVSIDRGGPIKASFFGVPALGRVEPAVLTRDAVLRVASLVDRAGTKVTTVQRRAEAKDYLDLDAILASGTVRLDAALAAARAIYGPTVNLQLSLKALVHFADRDLPSLPASLRTRLAQAVDAVDLSHLPRLGPEHPHREDRR